MPTPSLLSQDEYTGKPSLISRVTGILALVFMCVFGLSSVYCFHQKKVGDMLHEQAAWQCSTIFINYHSLVDGVLQSLTAREGAVGLPGNADMHLWQRYGGVLARLKQEFGLTTRYYSLGGAPGLSAQTHASAAYVPEGENGPPGGANPAGISMSRFERTDRGLCFRVIASLNKRFADYPPGGAPDDYIGIGVYVSKMLFPVYRPRQYTIMYVPGPAETASGFLLVDAGSMTGGIWDFWGRELKEHPVNGIDSAEIIASFRNAQVGFANTEGSRKFQVQDESFLATPILLPGQATGAYGQLYMLEEVSGRYGLTALGAGLFLAAGLCLLLVCKMLWGGRGKPAGRNASSLSAGGAGLSPLFETVFSRGYSACVVVAPGKSHPHKANAAALALFQADSPHEIDLGKLRPVAGYSPLRREWRGKGELMAFALAGKTVYCEVSRYQLDNTGEDAASPHVDEGYIIRDITHIVALRGKVRKHSRLMRVMLDQLPVCISMKDAGCRLVFYNAAFSKLFDCGPEELIGARKFPGWPAETMRRILSTDALALRSDSVVTGDQEIPVQGEGRVHTIAKRRISGPDNERYIITVGTDVTERVELHKLLEEQKSRAEAANYAKTRFLARMSHEIRTPMNAIIGTSYLALTTSPKGKLKKYLETIQRSARNLLGIINDILDFSKVEAGEMRLSIAPFSLAKVIAMVEEQITVLLHNTPVSFVSECPPLHRYLVGDSLRLGQVLLNLCNNAVKFTETGSITLRVTKTEETGENLTLLFEVEDTGIGIPKEGQSRLFDSFQQVEGSGQASRYGGTGLGLAIAQQFVSLMGSKIAVDSEPGRGTRFYFKLVMPLGGIMPEPLSSVAEALWSEVLLDHSGQNGAGHADNYVSDPYNEREQQEDSTGVGQGSMPRYPGATVLVVDDNEINRDIVVEILEQMDIVADTAENGQMAVEAVRTRRYDLIFMDVLMPVMDGLTATRKIRSLEHSIGEKVPIIALSANAMPDDHQRSEEAGMDGYLEKPIDFPALVACLGHYLGAAKKGSRKA